MKKVGMLLGTAWLLASMAGCGPSADSLVKQSIGLWQEAADLLAGITDEDTARAAKPHLEALVVKMRDLNKKARFQEMTPADMARLQQDNAEASAQVLQRVREASNKARQVAGAAPIVDRFNRAALHVR